MRFQILMRSTIKSGEEYLSKVPLPVLEKMQKRKKPDKFRDRLQAVALRKRGKKIGWIAGMVEHNPSTISWWLRQMAPCPRTPRSWQLMIGACGHEVARREIRRVGVD